jgi:glycosyltransferase involved in cell wall biosynthesis
MNAFDVFILPSHFEGLGIVLVEAQANGLKCIASDATPKEVNINGDVKFLSVDQNNIGCWIRQILETDVSKRNADINKFITAGYGIKNEVEKLQQLYLEYLGDLI